MFVWGGGDPCLDTTATQRGRGGEGKGASVLILYRRVHIECNTRSS